VSFKSKLSMSVHLATHPPSCLNHSAGTWREDGSGRPSLSHVNSMGRSPEEILQETCARLPSCRLDGKKNGSITGGSEIQNAENN
jgi:hypothetical protein